MGGGGEEEEEGGEENSYASVHKRSPLAILGWRLFFVLIGKKKGRAWGRDQRWEGGTRKMPNVKKEGEKNPFDVAAQSRR